MKIVLIVILTLAFFIRFFQLNVVPPSIANDEINIVLNAESILKTGQNMPGVVTGILGFPTGEVDTGVPELSSYILIPGIALFGFSGAKIIFVLLSLGIVFLSYLLVKKLVSKEAALIAAALSAINPWTIFFARTAYESIIATFFYLLGIYLILTKSGWRIFWALPFFLIAFLSYFAAKTLFLPITICCILATGLFKRVSLKPILFLNLVVVIFIAVYGYILSQTPANRLSELQVQGIKNLVDTKRTKSIDLPLNNTFENKFIEELKVRSKAALGTFSPTLIFVDGQPESIPSLSIPDHGPLYLIDLPLILAGIFFLARNNWKILAFFLSLILTTAVPNFINLAGTTYMLRTVILFPLLTMLSAIGIYQLMVKFRLHPWGVIIGLVYLFFFGNFLYQYFGRMPIERADGFFLHQRVVARYASLAETEGIKVTVIDQNPKHLFYRYLLFSNSYNSSSEVKNVNNQLGRAGYNLSNFSATSECPEDYAAGNTYIVDTSMKCPPSAGNSISDIKDGGSKYTIINDKLCGLFVKKTYPLIKSFNELKVEDLPKDKFCKTYITNFKL